MLLRKRMQSKINQLESKKFKTPEDKQKLEKLKTRIEKFEDNQRDIRKEFDLDNEVEEMDNGIKISGNVHQSVSHHPMSKN